MVLGFGTAILALCDRRFNMVSGVLFGDFSTLKRGLWEAFWHSSGAWGLAVALCRRLWAVLGSLWWSLRGLWDLFGRPWGRLWVPLACLWEAFAGIQGDFGIHFKHFGKHWEHFLRKAAELCKPEEFLGNP